LGDDLTVGVLSPLLAGSFFGRVVQGLVRHVAQLGGRVVAVQTLDATLGDDYTGLPPFSTPVGWEQVAGFVTIINAVGKSYLQDIRALGKPVVMVSHHVPGFECPEVLPDNRIGIMEAVRHLVEHGHNRIAFAGNISQADISERYDAYLETLKESGLRPEDELLFVAPDNLDAGGAAVAGAILDAGVPCSAVVAATDYNARGILRTLQAAGVSVPKEIAVTGFDDHPFASQLSPALASVRQNFDLLGERAGRLIMDMVQGKPTQPGEYRVKTSFIARDSCGCVGTPLPLRPESSPAMSPADRLRDNMTALLADPQVTRSQEIALEKATADICGIFDQAIEGSTVPRERVIEVADAIYKAFPRAETIKVTVGCAQQYRRELLRQWGFSDGRMEALDMCLRELDFALTAAELRAASDANNSLQASLRNEYYISMDLARARESDPKSLAWLARTQAHAACLGLWAGDSDAGWPEHVLEVTSVYGRAARERVLPGTTMRSVSFPPVEALTADGVEPEDAVFVLPVRTDARFWGMLAAVGPPAVVAATGRDIYFQWAAMLGMALDHEALVESLRRQREDLVRAYQRERDLVEEIRVSEERYALAAGAANDGLWDWDVAAATIYYSSRWKAMLGYTADEIGETPAEWFSRVHPEDRVTLEELVAARLRGEQASMECEHRIRASDGSYRWVLCRALAVPGMGRRATRLVGSLTDITERKELEGRLRQAALYDSLTGLPNRSLFMDRMARALGRARRIPGYQFSVLFLDLDDFKVVNDSLGHIAGDLLLVKVAERITSYLRENDTAVRFGGDEFAILLDNIAEPEHLSTIVQRLQEQLTVPYEIEGHEVVVSATIGIAASTTGYDNAEDMIRDADTAMYRAKGKERGSHVTFDNSMHVGVMSRLRTEQELRQAIENNQLELHYQPIVHLISRRVSGVEALVRWAHPERGWVAPMDFLPLAEETGLIVPLGRWVLEEACRQARAWHDGGYVSDEFIVSVNISNREFWHGGILPTVDAAMRAAGVKPGWLTVELTEGVIMRNSEVAEATLGELRGRGVEVYLDDFGTGYSSLDFLHRFPVDGLKVDRSFVARLGTDRRSKELVRTVIMMGRNLGVDVIAEGIEEADQEQTLHELGCHHGQGFLFARPAPAGVLESSLSRTSEALPART
jgi:diguanylate cyclase (GGDEF)-like protein/PAS domain S-box-containing protein